MMDERYGEGVEGLIVAGNPRDAYSGGLGPEQRETACCSVV